MYRSIYTLNSIQTRTCKGKNSKLLSRVHCSPTNRRNLVLHRYGCHSNQWSYMWAVQDGRHFQGSGASMRLKYHHKINKWEHNASLSSADASRHNERKTRRYLWLDTRRKTPWTDLSVTSPVRLMKCGLIEAKQSSYQSYVQPLSCVTSGRL